MKRLFGKKVLLEMQDFTDIISVDILPANESLINLLNDKGVKFNIRNKHFFEQHFSKINHQGVVINVKDGQKISTIEELIHMNLQHSTILIIDSIQDPQNFGAIIRSCVAFGVDAIIYKKINQTPITDFVAKSSMGGLAKISMIEVTNLSNAISFLKKAGYWIYATDISPKSMNYSEIKYDKKVVLIVGNENNGVSKILLENADFLIQIPMTKNMQSLNVSVATGILLAKVFEQKRD